MAYSHRHGEALRRLDQQHAGRPGRKIVGNEAGALVACIAFTNHDIPREVIVEAVRRARADAGDSLDLWEALARQRVREALVPRERPRMARAW